MGIAETFAHGPADLRRFAGAHPDHRVGAGDVGKLELIDAGAGLLGLFLLRVVERRHVFGPADFFKVPILIPDSRTAELFLARLRGYRMLGDSRVSLADVAGVGKDPPEGLHIPIR